ncbi:MAG: class A beta-lactamase [Pseudomonadota bacterium]
MPTSLPRPSRRLFLGGSTALIVLPSCGQNEGSAARNPLIELEETMGGRLGVAAKNLATGTVVSNRGDERFTFCSSFKWLLGALVLAKVDAGTESLATELTFGQDDILSHSPVLGPLVDQGVMTLRELCRATITTSDNAAANLLITHLGGPPGFTAQLRSFGDEVTRLDRYELELNDSAPGDPRDTSSPHAMLATMERFLFGDALKLESRDLLRSWMIDAVTGYQRLRAGMPDGWVVGDKTGTNLTNMNNNLAFAIPPEDATPDAGPILIVSYLDAPNPFSAERNETHAEIARTVIAEL